MDLKETKNNLEAYSYQIRDNLEGQYAAYMEDSVKAKFLAEIKQVVEWLYTSEGENATLEQYQKHLKAFKDLGTPTKARFEYWESIGDYYKLFEGLTETAQTKLGELAHLTDAQRETVIAKVGVANEFVQKVKADLSTRPRWQDPAHSLDSIKKMYEATYAECHGIFSTPVPKEEKKEEKPAEEAKAEEPAAEQQPAEENADVPMEEPKAE